MIDMTTRPVPTTITARPRTARHPGLARRVVGGFYLSMGGVHVGIIAVDPTVYRSFADAAYLSFVRTGWNEIFMADPRMWGLALTLGETLLGTALLVPLARADWQCLSTTTYAHNQNRKVRRR